LKKNISLEKNLVLKKIKINIKTIKSSFAEVFIKKNVFNIHIFFNKPKPKEKLRKYFLM